MATHRQDFPHLVINRDSPAHARNIVEKSRGLEGNTEEASTTDAEPSPAQQFVSLQRENMHLREQVQALNEEVAVLKGKLGGRQNGHGGVAESQGKEAERALLVAHPPTSQVVALEAQLQASQSEKKYFQALIEEKQGVIARLQKRVGEQDKTPHASAGLGSRMGPWPGGFDDGGEGRGAREERLARAATEAVAEVSQGAHGEGGKAGGRSVEAPYVAGRNAGTREQVEPVDVRTFESRAESMICPPLPIVGVGREGATGGGTDPGRGGGREGGRGEGDRAHELLSLEGRDVLTDELYEEMQRHKYNHPRLIIRACLDCLVPLFKVPSTAGALADFRAFFEGQRSIHTRAEEVLGNLRKGEGMSAPELDCLQRIFEVVVPPAARVPREEGVMRLEGEGQRDEEVRRGGSAQAGVRRRRKDFMRELVTAMNAFHGIKNKKPDLAYMCARAGVEARGLDTVEALQSGLKDHVALQQAFVQICAAMPPGQLSCNRRYVARKLFEFCGLDASVLVAKKGLQGRKPPSRKGMRSGEGGGGRKRKVEAVEELVRVDRPRRQRKRRRWWGEEEEEEGEEEEEEEGRKEGKGERKGREGGREDEDEEESLRISTASEDEMEEEEEDEEMTVAEEVGEEVREEEEEKKEEEEEEGGPMREREEGTEPSRVKDAGGERGGAMAGGEGGKREEGENEERGNVVGQKEKVEPKKEGKSPEDEGGEGVAHVGKEEILRRAEEVRTAENREPRGPVMGPEGPRASVVAGGEGAKSLEGGTLGPRGLPGREAETEPRPAAKTNGAGEGGGGGGLRRQIL